VAPAPPATAGRREARYTGVSWGSAANGGRAPAGANFNEDEDDGMAIIDFLKKQFIDIIEWTDDSRDTLSFRFPDEDKEIKNGAQLIVRESQAAQFVYLGEFGDTFGPGKHTLTTDNIPILTNLKSWKYALESPFKADVYYVVTRTFTGNKWGTANPVMMRDQDFGIVRLRAYGTYDFRISDVKKFLKEVAGTDNHFRLDEFADTMRSRLVSVFSDALAESKIPALDVAARYAELGEALLPIINPIIAEKYGLTMTAFVVENVSVPPEVEQAIDKRSSMAAVGNLNDYVKFQMAQGMEKGGAGAGGMAAEMAVGMAMAQQMMNQTGGLMAQGTPGIQAPAAPAATAAAVTPELLTPAQAAQALGVGEADVIASIEAGDLKGKKIGSQWRITRAALDQFLQS
jgi:excisionase family DNA binding protein